MALVYRQPAALLLATHRHPLPRLPPRPWTERDLPDVIRAARVQAGLDKVTLGRRLRRSGQAVRSWETGRTRPPLETRRRLERVLHLPHGSLA